MSLEAHDAVGDQPPALLVHPPVGVEPAGGLQQRRLGSGFKQWLLS